MNTKTNSEKRNHLVVAAILCATSLLINSCASLTPQTAYTVQTQPMSVDLEKKVLRETGLSGMATGAIIGGIGSAVVIGFLTKMAGGSDEQVKRNATAALVTGGLIGGVKGYQKGKSEGQKIVAQSMDNDKLNELLKGAKAYNQHLASYNLNLRDKLAEVKKIPDPKEKQFAYASLRKQSDKELKATDVRIAERTKAIDNPAWKYSEKSKYRAQKDELVARKASLVAMNNQMAKLEQAIVY